MGSLETMLNISGPFMVNFLNRNHRSGVWLGADVRMRTKKTCVQCRLDYVLKTW